MTPKPLAYQNWSPLSIPSSARFPVIEVSNEGWMLRLVLHGLQASQGSHGTGLKYAKLGDVEEEMFSNQSAAKRTPQVAGRR